MPAWQGSQRRLERGGGYKAHALGSGDLHGLLRLRIPAHTGGAIHALEGAETHELYGTGFLNSFCNGAEHGIDRLRGMAFGGVSTEGVLDCFDQVGLVHGCWKWVVGRHLPCG